MKNKKIIQNPNHKTGYHFYTDEYFKKIFDEEMEKHKEKIKNLPVWKLIDGYFKLINPEFLKEIK